MLLCYYHNVITFLDLDTVYANVRTINQSIVTLQNHALDINTTLLSLQVVSDNFTVACSTDLICEETIPIVPFFNGLDEVNKGEKSM